jgi:hypothetical protein
VLRKLRSDGAIDRRLVTAGHPGGEIAFFREQIIEIEAV